jgi:DNA (cytosine-5)-methyltransferase 1
VTAKGRLKPYSVVSYFCGCGGLDLGFRGGFRYRGEDFPRLPFEIKAAYDNDARCVETYNGYFGEGRAQIADLASLDAQKAPEARALIGGFPCQEFSSCGPLRGLGSARGRLYRALVSYMVARRPEIVIGENVVNLERMARGAVLRTIRDDLAEAGYRVEVWKLFAPDYGVPQRRERLFIVCARDDVHARRGFPPKPEARFKGAHRSVEWAIGDLARVADESVPNQSQFFAAARAKKGNGQGDEKNKKDLPAYTVRANPKSRVQFHYSLDRRLTIRELARIQTFPDDFLFTHPKTASVSQIGNAVPPTLAYAVARSVGQFLEGAATGREGGATATELLG